MIIALQAYPGDIREARELLRLIRDIEGPNKRSDVEFMISLRRDVSADDAAGLVQIISDTFAVVHVHHSKRFGEGWPYGCNDLWAETMIQCYALRRRARSHSATVLTIEPDCLPMRRDWIEAMVIEAAVMQNFGKLCAGTLYPIVTQPDKMHINGNAIFDINIIRRHPELQGAGDSGWDAYHADLLVRVGMHTEEIAQEYQRAHMTEQELSEYRTGDYRPALLHGLKDPERFTKIRNILEI